jgi:Ca-activated chloride channel homolog
MARRSKAITILAAVCALTLGFSDRQGVVAQGLRPAFRSGVELIALSVTVSNPGHQYVGDLGRDDFSVFENGVPQTVTFFGRSAVPLELALLLDSSASMEQTLPIAQEAAMGFARTLRSADLASIIDFDSTVKTAQAFTNNIPALEDAIRGTTAGGSTALYNAVYIALKELTKLIPQDDRDKPRRRAVIVLSDGDDTSSLVGFDEVLDLASRSDIVIYTIGLGRREPNRSDGQEGEFVLRRLAEQTGGRAFFPKEARELAGVYGEIREELSSQYSLAYESNRGRSGGEWRRILVRVNRPNVIVRTRQGYFAGSK